MLNKDNRLKTQVIKNQWPWVHVDIVYPHLWLMQFAHDIHVGL